MKWTPSVSQQIAHGVPTRRSLAVWFSHRPPPILSCCDKIGHEECIPSGPLCYLPFVVLWLNWLSVYCIPLPVTQFPYLENGDDNNTPQGHGKHLCTRLSLHLTLNKDFKQIKLRGQKGSGSFIQLNFIFSAREGKPSATQMVCPKSHTICFQSTCETLYIQALGPVHLDQGNQVHSKHFWNFPSFCELTSDFTLCQTRKSTS